MSIRLRGRQRGVTLIEMILFMVIIGVALAGIIAVMNFTTQRSADPVRRKQALMIAEALIEEVELANFSYCDVGDANAGDSSITGPAGCASTPENWGPEANNQRPFDNINDYVAAPNTATEAFGTNGVLLDANGNALPLTGFTARVTITPDTLGSILAPAGTVTYQNADVLRITVTVGYDGQTLTLDGVRTRYAPASL